MGLFSKENRERSLANSVAYIENLKKDYKGEPGIGGVRGFSPYVTDASGEQYSRGIVTSGARGSIGSGNSNWMVNPDTGQEEPALAGPDGKYYLPSDLIKTFGSLENAGKVAGAAYPDAAPGTMFGWSMAQQGDNFLGTEDDLKDFVEHAGPLVAGYFGGGALLGGEFGGAAAGDAALAGGAEVGSGSAVSASGATGTGAAGTGALPSEIGFEGAAGYTPSEIGFEAGAPGAAATAPAAAGSAGAGATGAATAGAAATGLGSLLPDGSAGIASDLLRGLPGVFGAFAAKDQADNYRDLAEKYMGFGAPSRARYESSFAPGFTMANDPGYTDALGLATKEFLHKASIGGNPADSPNAWMQTLSDVNSKFAFPALQNYRNTNASAGGLASLATAAPGMDTAAVKSGGGVYDALGGAAADIFTPKKTLADYMREARF